MIELIPALDIIDGRCVRLTKGDYEQVKVYNEHPVDIAKSFEELGVKRLHIVDLDGAKSCHVVNIDILEKIAATTDLSVDYGGGIKSDDDIKAVFEHGADMATIGSVAITNQELFLKWLDLYGGNHIILGADVRDGKVSINGWKEDSNTDIFSFLNQYQGYGVKNILCTDISRDGTLEGPSFELYGEIRRRFPDLYLIASGGVAEVADVMKLEAMSVQSVILGKSIYEGRIDLEKLLKDDRIS